MLALAGQIGLGIAEGGLDQQCGHAAALLVQGVHAAPESWLIALGIAAIDPPTDSATRGVAHGGHAMACGQHLHRDAGADEYIADAQGR